MEALQITGCIHQVKRGEISYLMTVILRSVKKFVRYYCAESSSNQNPENNLVL